MFIRTFEAHIKTIFEKSKLVLFISFYYPSTIGFGVSPRFWTSSFPPMILGEPPLPDPNGCQMLHDRNDRNA